MRSLFWAAGLAIAASLMFFTVAYATGGKSHDDVPGQECEHGVHLHNPHCSDPPQDVSPTPTSTATATVTATATATGTSTATPTVVATSTPTVVIVVEDDPNDDPTPSPTPRLTSSIQATATPVATGQPQQVPVLPPLLPTPLASATVAPNTEVFLPGATNPLPIPIEEIKVPNTGTGGYKK